jgi:hypothetical protein
MTQTYFKEGLEYTASNHRMRYHPDFHENHGKPFSKEDLIYLCSAYEGTRKADIAFALGRTQSTIMTKAHSLRKTGRFAYYKKLGDMQ